MGPSNAPWHVSIDLAEEDGMTILSFAHALNAADEPSSFGPGWVYYLARLVADRDGAAMPRWDDYYPAMAKHYTD